MKNDNFNHYFISKDHKESDYFYFDATYKNVYFKFKSCSDVFSKNSLDYGSLVLVSTILKYSELYSGKILDMCAGYGTIGILLSKFLPAEYDMCDINTTAIELAKENAKSNNVTINNIFESNMFDNVTDIYNHIVSNPPIKTGKKLLLEFIDESYNHLFDDGTITLVIKKNLGADSLKSYMIKIFGNCVVLARDKGYYILHSKKVINTTN